MGPATLSLTRAVTYPTWAMSLWRALFRRLTRCVLQAKRPFFEVSSMSDLCQSVFYFNGPMAFMCQTWANH